MINRSGQSTLPGSKLAWWSLAVAALLVASFLLAAPARAGGTVGTGTAASCTEAALDAALTGGGTVTFNCGGSKTITFTSEKVITQDTVIQGGGVTIFNGGSSTRLFRVVEPARLTLSDLTLTKGYNPNDGGAILNFGTLTLNNVEARENASGTCGGVVWTRGAAIITNSRFEANSAVSGGGVICTSNGGAPRVQVTGSRFQANGAAQAGTSVGYGGAISLNPTGILNITQTEFWLNKGQFGGALAILPGATATIRNSVTNVGFRNNIATHSGGAIYNLGSLNLSDVQIGYNYIREDITTNGYGAGVASLGTLTIQNSFFYFNEGLTGGGLYVASSSDSSRTDLQRVSFQRNRAKFNGGGIFANNTTLAITNTTFSYNTSAGSGGGLACAQCARMRVSNSSFVTNTAAYGGGLYVSAAPVSGYNRVESVTFSGNQSLTSRGGGVYNQGNLELYFSTLANNGNGVHSVLGANTRFRSSVLHNPGYNNCGSEGQVQYSNDGANHVSDDSCGPSFSAKGNPQLGSLQSERQQQYWFTYFHLPLAGSPLINLGHSACPERDQRGAVRPDACDIGAVEFGGLMPSDPSPGPNNYRVYLPIIVR